MVRKIARLLSVNILRLNLLKLLCIIIHIGGVYEYSKNEHNLA